MFLIKKTNPVLRTDLHFVRRTINIIEFVHQKVEVNSTHTAIAHDPNQSNIKSAVCTVTI